MRCKKDSDVGTGRQEDEREEGNRFLDEGKDVVTLVGVRIKDVGWQKTAKPFFLRPEISLFWMEHQTATSYVVISHLQSY